jgi:hypothetical protein
MVLVHRTYDRWQRAAPPSGSVAHDRASSVDPRNFGVRRVMIRAPNQTSEIVSLGVFKGEGDIGSAALAARRNVRAGALSAWPADQSMGQSRRRPHCEDVALNT